jgi:cytochrome c peroxidase
MSMSMMIAASPIDEPIKPLPLGNKENPVRAQLGRQLFHDARLSANGRVSCGSCHTVEQGGGGGELSIGVTGVVPELSAPTVFNAALNFKQFWNGRADSLEQQVDMVIQNPVEMGSKWADVLATVSRDPGYARAFQASYTDGVSIANIQNAISTFERTLITPNSRFDQYLRGDKNAITADEKMGYAKFKQYGCIACHQGVNVGGNMFQKFGVMGDYLGKRGRLTNADLGRYLVTGEESDKLVFKVPSLRNVALTAPYFHDGSAKTLDVAVDVMFKYQLGRQASAADKAAIIEFLNTLTGDVAGRL